MIRAKSFILFVIFSIVETPSAFIIYHAENTEYDFVILNVKKCELCIILKLLKMTWFFTAVQWCFHLAQQWNRENQAFR